MKAVLQPRFRRPFTSPLEASKEPFEADLQVHGSGALHLVQQPQAALLDGLLQLRVPGLEAAHASQHRRVEGHVAGPRLHVAGSRDAATALILQAHRPLADQPVQPTSALHKELRLRPKASIKSLKRGTEAPVSMRFCMKAWFRAKNTSEGRRGLGLQQLHQVVRWGADLPHHLQVLQGQDLKVAEPILRIKGQCGGKRGRQMPCAEKLSFAARPDLV